MRNKISFKPRLKSGIWKLSVTAVVFLLIAVLPSYAQKEIAIKAGKILTISGAVVTDGVILIKDGKIVDVGSGIAIPSAATVIDAANSVVMPGLVDASADTAIRGDANEQSEEITPSFRISGALDPQSKELKRMVQMGVTTLYIPPGSRNIIGGLGVVIKPAGKTSAEMIIKDGAGLKIAMGSSSTWGNRVPFYEHPSDFYYRRPTTRMGVAWMLRESLYNARQDAKKDTQILSSAMRGEIPIHVSVRRAIDIRTALRIAGEYGLQIVLDECTEGYKVAREIAEKRAPVVLGPFYYYPGDFRQYYEGREVNWNNAGILAKAGVKVAFSSNALPEAIDLLTVAAFAVRHGMPPDEALKAITLTPAEILGVADRVGSIEKGKDANILILNGDPLNTTSNIKRVILNGETVYQANE